MSNRSNSCPLKHFDDSPAVAGEGNVCCNVGLNDCSAHGVCTSHADSTSPKSLGANSKHINTHIHKERERDTHTHTHTHTERERERVEKESLLCLWHARQHSQHRKPLIHLENTAAKQQLA